MGFCRSRGLTAIPRAFPQDATVIDMSHNQIKTLGEIPPLEGIGLNPIYLKAFDQNQP